MDSPSLTPGTPKLARKKRSGSDGQEVLDKIDLMEENP
jgi:hypothetical protein